jgi:hypothetical protein
MGPEIIGHDTINFSPDRPNIGPREMATGVVEVSKTKIRATMTKIRDSIGSNWFTIMLVLLRENGVEITHDNPRKSRSPLPQIIS